MRFDMSGGRKIAILIASLLLILAPPFSAQTKKLQVVADLANLYLEPDERSPIVETLIKGATMTLASAIKTRTNWFYVYYISLQTGKTRSGYILDSLVRKLYADIKVISISSEDEITQPRDLDFNDAYQPIIDWGSAKDKIINTEGRPSGQEKIGGLEVIRYKRPIMAKNCQVEYIFDNNRLVTVRYNLLEKYADKNRYIEDYLKIKEHLVSKIGAPRTDTVTWQDPTYRSKITLAGSANRVAFGAEFNGLKFKSASF
jgi:hypothetical protein